MQTKKYFHIYTVFALVLVATVLVSAQSILLGTKTFDPSLRLYRYYNNYIIFKQSYFHLLENVNLYIRYPEEQFDLFKYSPTFALLMGPLAQLPDWLGLSIWNLLNSLVLILSIWKLRVIPKQYKIGAILFIFLELIISIQNAQSNALMAGLIIMAFNLLEKKKTFWAVLLLSLTVYIKIFGLVAFVLLLFYPSRWRAMAYSVFWFVLLALLPLVVINFQDLIIQYQNWGAMLLDDHSASLGISVAGVVSSLLGTDQVKSFVLLLGALLFLSPLVFYKRFKDLPYRALFLASVLLWVVLFNHKAESPTFILAVAGVAIWFFMSAPTQLRKILLVCVLLFTSISCTDLVPAVVKTNVLEPYRFKVLPCIVVWVCIWLEQVGFVKTKYFVEK